MRNPMGNKKQTAVEWLVEQIEAHKIEIIYSDKIDSIKCLPSIVAQAKAMEKEQIKNAYGQGVADEAGEILDSTKDAEEYYNKNYGE
jgi:hypothetical protein